MLQGIPAILSPELVKAMMEMGHGDELVLGDAHFPAAANAKRLIRCDGLAIPPLLEAILALFPIDTYSAAPVGLMSVVPGDGGEPPIWTVYQSALRARADGPVEIEYLERFDFYRRAREAYAIVATGETAQYANLILRKGVVR